MFDLPVRKKKQREYATKFRKTLLDNGFHMAQYSVYYRLLDGKDSIEAMKKRIITMLPNQGSIHILAITDKQYENIHVIENHERKAFPKTEQLVLF